MDDAQIVADARAWVANRAEQLDDFEFLTVQLLHHSRLLREICDSGSKGFDAAARHSVAMVWPRFKHFREVTRCANDLLPANAPPFLEAVEEISAVESAFLKLTYSGPLLTSAVRCLALESSTSLLTQYKNRILQQLVGTELNETWSSPRSPQAWRKLLDAADQPSSERHWRNLRTKHDTEMESVDGNKKSVRITRQLAECWGLTLPEFAPG